MSDPATQNATDQPPGTSLTGDIIAVVGGAWERLSAVLFQPRKLAILRTTADVALTADQAGIVVSNVGAAGTVTVSLPAAVEGLHYTVVVEAAQALRIDPNGTETIAIPSSGVQQAAGKYITNSTVGSRVHFVCITPGTWDAITHQGTWTAEP